MPIIQAHHCTVYSSVHISKERIVPNWWYAFASKHISGVKQRRRDKRQGSNSVDPAGHSASQQKHRVSLNHNKKAQSETNTPTPSNISPNLAQASLITHSAWARDGQHGELRGPDLYAKWELEYDVVRYQQLR